MKAYRDHLLVVAVLLIAATAMIYQFTVVSSLVFIIGDSLVLFSVFTGVFLFSMGLGSLIAAKGTVSAERFVGTQFKLAVLGLVALPCIFLLFATTHYLRRTGMNLPIAGITLSLWAGGLLIDVAFGALTGMQLPMLQALFRNSRGEERSLATLLGFDYFGSFLGAAAFPILLFPHLGLFRTVFLAALVNTAVAMMSARLLGVKRSSHALWAAGLFVFVTASFLASHRFEQIVDTLVYGSH